MTDNNDKNTLKSIRKPRIKKEDKYKAEQIIMCNKLLEILDPVTKNTFILSEIDGNKEILDKINNLESEIRKYFNIVTITSLDKEKVYKRPWLSIIKTILKKLGYDFKSCDFKIKNDDKVIRTKKYTIFKIK